jgi:hypothetical protein
MALSWGAGPGHDPADVHLLWCSVWRSDDPCTCSPRLSTAQRIDRIQPAPVPLEEQQ